MDDYYVSFLDVYTHLLYHEDDKIDSVQLNCLNEDSLHIDKECYKDKTSSSMMFDLNIYLKNILTSYKNNSDNIWYQLSLDLPRTPVHLFNTPVTSVSVFKSLTKHYKHLQITVNNIKLDVQTYLAMICNQSSFCFPFVVIHRLFSELEQSETLFALPDDRLVDVKTDENNVLTIQLTAVFGVINTDTCKTVKKIKTVLDMKMEESTGVINWYII